MSDKKITFKEALIQLKEKRFVVALLMGFAAGLPLMLTLRTMQAWMKDAGLDLTTIGLVALIQLPYTIKFLWSPILDRYTLPFLGRRRGWLALSQMLLFLFIILLAFLDPRDNLGLLVAIAVIVSYVGATQDILIDAYRRETLAEEELGMGSTVYIYGYRVAMYVTTAGAMIIAGYLSWKAAYIAMGAAVVVGLLTTLWADEPEDVPGAPRTLKEAVILPFLEFFKRKGALLILLFIILYKLGDTMAGNMVTPFYLDIGFSLKEIALITKTIGLFSTLIGAFIGGLIIYKLGIKISLYVFGVFQAISTAGFALLNEIGSYQWMLAATVTFEDLSAGMGTAAFMALMASLSDKRFTATQYALLTSLMKIPQVFVAAPTGLMAEKMGWTPFFLFCAVIAIPGLLILHKVIHLTKTEIKVDDGQTKPVEA